MILYIVLGIIAALVVLIIALYNSLIRLKVTVDEATADIDTFLKQRYDMIPNLVEIVKGYAKHEKSTLTELTKLRTAAMSAKGLDEKAKYENQISQTLKTLFAVAENYPDLKANQNFLDLQQKLTALEDSIQKSRRFYNGTVRDFNTKIAVFPNNLLAGILGFKTLPFFEASEAEKENVKVSFDEKPKAEDEKK